MNLLSVGVEADLLHVLRDTADFVQWSQDLQLLARLNGVWTYITGEEKPGPKPRKEDYFPVMFPNSTPSTTTLMTSAGGKGKGKARMESSGADNAFGPAVVAPDDTDYAARIAEYQIDLEAWKDADKHRRLATALLQCGVDPAVRENIQSMESPHEIWLWLQGRFNLLSPLNLNRTLVEMARIKLDQFDSMHQYLGAINTTWQNIMDCGGNYTDEQMVSKIIQGLSGQYDQFVGRYLRLHGLDGISSLNILSFTRKLMDEETKIREGDCSHNEESDGESMGSSASGRVVFRSGKSDQERGHFDHESRQWEEDGRTCNCEKKRKLVGIVDALDAERQSIRSGSASAFSDCKRSKTRSNDPEEAANDLNIIPTTGRCYQVAEYNVPVSTSTELEEDDAKYPAEYYDRDRTSEYHNDHAPEDYNEDGTAHYHEESYACEHYNEDSTAEHYDVFAAECHDSQASEQYDEDGTDGHYDRDITAEWYGSQASEQYDEDGSEEHYDNDCASESYDKDRVDEGCDSQYLDASTEEQVDSAEPERLLLCALPHDKKMTSDEGKWALMVRNCNVLLDHYLARVEVPYLLSDVIGRFRQRAQDHEMINWRDYIDNVQNMARGMNLNKVDRVWLNLAAVDLPPSLDDDYHIQTQFQATECDSPHERLEHGDRCGYCQYLNLQRIALECYKETTAAKRSPEDLAEDGSNVSAASPVQGSRVETPINSDNIEYF